ncbi:MAG: biotin--[acetyl-CoA-carboxylase] ligase [Okeania sp. SIO2H7]|nr:biotin--[acetyl-CoA-carboxylase] ligase [Okeania sp. SIO2H7]
MLTFAREKFIAALKFQREKTGLNNLLLDSNIEENLHIFESLPSTNKTLWELIDSGAPPGTVVIATVQTAGKGQWGRSWISEPGGLYLSVAIAPHLPISHTAQLTMSGALGIATALRDRQIPVWLKWPNDLILQNRKPGGILTEARVERGQIVKAIVGVGLNWANAVPQTGINLQSYFAKEATREFLSLEMLGAIVLQGTELGLWRLKEEGIERLLTSYCQLLSGRGRQISIDGRSGKIVGVTPNGELRVKVNSDAAASAEILIKPGTIALGYDSQG